MASASEQVLQAYVKKFGQIPNEPNLLVSFSRTDPEIPTIIYSEAKKVLNKIKTSIKSGKKVLPPKWQVGDEVLISKDRTGILHYIGKVPEMGDDNIWYGIELTSGTLGQHDGAVKGKRYFQTNGKRGMFIPEKKLRRRLNRKDRERRNSYAEISNHVKDLQKQYAGTEASVLYPGAAKPIPISDVSDKQNNGHLENMTTLVFESREQAQKYDNSRYQSTTLNNVVEHDYEHEQKTSPSPPPSSRKKVKKSSRSPRKRSGSGASNASRRSESRSSRDERHHSSKNSRSGRRHRRDEESSEDSDVSDMSELDQDNDSSPTVKTFDTLLKYILRQKGGYREGLLDVYANPGTHPLIVEAFSQMKELQPDEQAFLWPALLKRWSKYAHKI